MIKNKQDFEQFEPKNPTRFLVEIKDIPSYLIKKCDIPNKSESNVWNFQLYLAVNHKTEKVIDELYESRDSITVLIKEFDVMGKEDMVWEINDVRIRNYEYTNNFDWNSEDDSRLLNVETVYTDYKIK